MLITWVTVPLHSMPIQMMKLAGIKKAMARIQKFLMLDEIQ